MKKRWMSVLAIVLVVCILLNHQQIAELARGWITPAFTTEDGSVSANLIVQNVSGNDTLVENQPAPDTNVGTEVVVPDAIPVVPGESTENTPSESVPGGDATEPEGTVPEGDATVSGGDATAPEGDGTVSGGDVAEPEGDASVSGNDVEDAVPEDIIIEGAVEEENVLLGNMMFMASDDPEGGLPSTVDEYLAEKSKGEFFISSAQDFIDAQYLCTQDAVDGFAGITLTILKPNNASDWDFTSDAILQGFTGIGDAAHPFKGTIKTTYTQHGSMELKLAAAPLFAYLGEGARVEWIDFNCVNTSAAVAQNISGTVSISNILVKGTIKGSSDAGIVAGTIAENANVTMDNVIAGESNARMTLNGVTVGCAAGSVGAHAMLNVSNMTGHIQTITGTTIGGLVGSVGSNAEVSASNVTVAQGAAMTLSGTTTGGFVGAVAESGNITLTNVNQYISQMDGAADVGCVVGNIGKSANITLANSRIDGTSQIVGANAGAIAGKIDNGAVISLADGAYIGGTNNAAIAVLGSEAAGGCYGVVIGNHTWDLTANTGKLYSRCVGNGVAAYAGQYAGKLLPEENATGQISIINGNGINVEVDGQGYSGGVVGLCGEKTSITFPAGVFTISGGIDGANGAGGGIAGAMVNPYIELEDITVTAKVSGKYAGGIVGQIEGGQCLIRNVTVNEVTGTNASGGVLGNVISSAKVELQDTIAITDKSKIHGNGNNGLIVGMQSQSLVYLSGVEGMVNGVSQIQIAGSADYVPYEKEVGTYGGLWRNQSLLTGVLIGDGTLANVGKLNNKITQTGGSYQLTSAADFEALAIALVSEGALGLEVFEPQSDYNGLLAASYTVNSPENKVDISYNKTGIVTLNRNDTTATEYAFTGSMQGINENTTIVQSIAIKGERNLGLFSCVTLNPHFSNLVFEGTVENGTHVGGIAYEHTLSGTEHGLTLTNITMRKVFENNDGTIGGVLGDKLSGGTYHVTADNITLASEIIGGAHQKLSGFITKITNATVDIDGVKLGGSMTLTTGNDAGGFLGREWNGVDGIVKNITVMDGTTYSSTNVFGVLIGSASNAATRGGHLILDTVNLDGLTVNANADKANCSLLVRDAKSLVMEVIDYDCSGCTVNNPGANFDEIAGVTRSDQNRPIPGRSGIVSLHSRGNYFPNYHYEYQATYVGGNGNRYNNNTLYYYDVFQYLEKEETDAEGNVTRVVNEDNLIADGILDNKYKVLLWSITQMAPDGVRGTFKKYFKDKYMQSNQTHTYTFSGNLDLSELSYYPASSVVPGNYIYKGINNATITFGSKTDRVDMGAWRLNNEWQMCSQHVGLQSGLLYNDNGAMAMQVSDITLSGTIANLGEHSGALLNGLVGLDGNGTFTNITLNDLWVADYTDNQMHRVGLLIGKLPGHTVTFNNIVMTGYDKETTKKAAAALIAYAGGIANTNIKLTFRNMVLADDKSGDAAHSHNGDVLAHASLICNYDYTDDIEQYVGSGMYLFSRADFESGNVTLGSQITSETEFSDTADKVLTAMSEKGLGDNTWYIPYTCDCVTNHEDIDVNPKTGDILKGCGTYEDPYIIENEKQLLTLYRYLGETAENRADYQYKEFYEVGDGWKIIKPGDDSEFCETQHGAAWNGTSFVAAAGCVCEPDDAARYTDADFPTPEELSHAYYQLAANIDISALEDTTYKRIAEEFIGFGSSLVPFTGVWDGNDKTITLANRAGTDAATNYGFIQYAQGAVVKDLTIKTSDTDINARIANISGTGGGVIGTILGGDNIIDNVTIDGMLGVQGGNSVAVGGYVGVVKKGGLILRNITDNSLANFETDTSTLVHPLVGVIAGKVQDGYVLYEGAGITNDNTYVWEGNGGNTLYPVIPNYSILNGDELANCGITVTVGEAMPETVTVDGNTLYPYSHEITIDIPNAAALQVMSMALNSDALNVKYSAEANYKEGYTELTRSRKADYDQIGNCTAQTPDYLAAAKYDNVMSYGDGTADKAFAYPYLYNYMGITEDAYLQYVIQSNDDGGYYSILNPVTPYTLADGARTIKIYRPIWKLTQTTYDMTQEQFGKSFRGIGALYQVGASWGATFRGNFDGSDATIEVEMRREILCDADLNNDYCTRVGLFNTIMGNAHMQTLYGVEGDFKTPDATEENIFKCFEIKDFTLKGSVDLSDNSLEAARVLAGGVTACIEDANVIVSGVKTDLQNSLQIGEVSEKVNQAGGIIGWISSGYVDSHVLIRDCQYIGTEETPIMIEGGSYVGGFVGRAKAYGDSILKIQDSQIAYLHGHSRGKDIGGFVGCVTGFTVICQGTEGQPISIQHSALQNEDWVSTGGFVGSSNDEVYIKYALCEENQIGCTPYGCHTGGLVGMTEGNLSISDIVCRKLELQAHQTIGGIVGFADTESAVSTISEVTMEDLVLLEGAFDDQIPSGLGGIVGKSLQTMSIDHATVNGTQNADETYNFSITGADYARTMNLGVGGIVGYHASSSGSNVLTLKECTVDRLQMSVPGASIESAADIFIAAGGLVGYARSPIALQKDTEAAPAAGIGTSNLNISVPKKTDLAEGVDVDIMTSGGCFGLVDAKISTGVGTGGSLELYYDGLTAQTNTVSGKQAGGMVGYLRNGELRLSGIQLADGSVLADEVAGGAIGVVKNNKTSGINPYEKDTDEPVNRVSNMTITARNAGGFIGDFNIVKANTDLRMENIVVESSSIIGTHSDGTGCSAGGFIALLDGGVNNGMNLRVFDVDITENTIAVETTDVDLTADEVKVLGAGGLIGKVEHTTGSGTRLFFDRVSIAEDNQIGVRAVDTDAVKLVRVVESGYQLADLEAPAGADIVTYSDAVEKLETEYGYCVGTMVGKLNAGLLHMIIFCSKEKNGVEFASPVLEQNTPVIDVGRYASSVGVNAYRSNCNIVYGAGIGESEDYAKNLADMQAKIEESRTAYTSDNVDWNELLTINRASEEEMAVFENAYQESYTTEDGTVITFPLLVYRVQDGTLQAIMEDIINVMTNGAGNPACNIKPSFIKTTVSAKQFDGTTVTDASTESSITATYSNNKTNFKLNPNRFDTFENGVLTFSEITITYGDVDGSSNYGYHKKVFKIPVFTEEPILYGVHSMIMEGKVTDVATIKKSGTGEKEVLYTDDNGETKKMQLVMANDSDYTLLLEYTYGKARKQMLEDVAVDKVFYLTNTNGETTLPVGTQLLLIDVTNGNKPYYYTVQTYDPNNPELTDGVIQFTEFKDSNGNFYQNQSISGTNLEDETDEGCDYYTDLGGHQLTETGVERFLLTVLCNPEAAENRAYDIHAGMELDGNYESRFQLEGSHSAEGADKESGKETVWSINAIPGLTVELVEEGSGTVTDGTISKSGGLTVNAAFAITAENPAYWATKKQGNIILDSANSGKYLDVAFYLKDSENKNRVKLPSGTNISYLQSNGSYSTYKVIMDNSQVYYYKDIRDLYDALNHEYRLDNITEDTTVHVEYLLDFSGADLSGITEKNYNAWIELLRTSNKDYPTGSGNLVEAYSNGIDASVTQELGFAIKADDLETLGINTYMLAEGEQQIPAHVMFDFGEILQAAGTGTGPVITKWSNYDYHVTYQIYEKKLVDGKTQYVPYTGQDIVIEAQAGIKEASAEKQYARLETIYDISDAQIENGNTERPVQGLVSFPVLITVDTEALTAGQLERLTNYKVEAVLTIKDANTSGEISAGSAKTTKDFFIYTVTKLKWDL